MTTALIWWIAVLGITGGLVVVLLVLIALGSLLFLGWISDPPGWVRLAAALPLLAMCALAGLGLAACLRTMAGRRVRSWWLLAGLAPAATGAALALGA